MASKASTKVLQFDIQWASIALLWYDYALTFPAEVEYLWSSKFRLSTFLYILCRYALPANILYLINIAGKLTDNCNVWYQIIGALSVLGRAAVIIVFTGRTWAVWGKNRAILAYMGLLGATCVAFDISHVPGLRCTGSSSNPIVNDLLAIMMVVFEFSSAILNSVRCFQAFRAHNQSWKEQREGFQFLLFEQGLFYFSIISLFTTGAVILNFQAPSGFFQRLLNAFTLPLSGILTARLLLHIREWEYKRSPAAMNVSRYNEPGQASSHFTFRAAVATMSDDFGSDPVARYTLPDERGEFDSEGSSTDLELRSSANSESHDINSLLESGSSVREGKKPLRE